MRSMALAAAAAFVAAGCATADDEMPGPDAWDVPAEWDAAADLAADGSDPAAEQDGPLPDLPVDAPDVPDLPADTIPDPSDDIPAEDAPVDPAADDPAPDPDATDAADAADTADTTDTADAPDGDVPACDPALWYGYDAADTPISIPDSDAAGITSWIDVSDCDVEVWDVRVTVNIQHTYIGDLRVMLISPDGRTVILHNQTGGMSSNIVTTYPTLTDPYETLCKATRQSSLGRWGLKVSDHAWADTGQLQSWRLELSGTSSGCRSDWWYTTDPMPMSIPDNNATGISSTIQVTDAGAITALRVGVDIEHSWIGDLQVSVTSPAGTTVMLHDRSGGMTADIKTFYPTPTTPAESLDVLLGTERMGTWTLRVSDHASADSGELIGWVLEIN
jgi:subtilisin-like proprotein convertase family protein